MKAEFFSPDTQAFLRLLSRHDVRYLVVGGIAVIYHGYPRLTGDVDFFYERDPDNVDRLWRALVDFWGGSVPGLQDSTELMDPDLVVQFGRPPNRIDLISDLGTIAFQAAWDRRVVATIESDEGVIRISVIGREDLLQSKREAGRPKDLDDLARLADGGSTGAR